METIVEILELVGLVLVAIWVYHHVTGGRKKRAACCSACASGATTGGVDLSFPNPTGGCS